MKKSDHYDAVVIGAGQGGGPLATAFARSGLTTALIERKHVGGTCINEGCTPTKTMVASARVAHLVRRAADYGVRTGPIAIDMETVRERKRTIVESFRKGSQTRIEQTAGLDLFFGTASFIGTKVLEARLHDGSTRTLSADRIVVDTGTRPSIPPIEGLSEVTYLDSTSIMELARVPSHLLVLGGGYVGLEFAQMFRRLGAAVSIIQRGSQLLTREDPDIAALVSDILREDGIEILLKMEASTVRQGDSGEIELVLRRSGVEERRSGSHLLVAVGRVPNTEDLNLPATGVERDARGYIRVNDRLETTVPGIYALGDVTGGPAFTHVSYDDYRILRSNLLEGRQASTAGRVIPYTVYIDPQLGRVGMSEREARRAGHDVTVATMPMAHVARALEVDESRGLMKAVVDARSTQLLGCAILGIEGGEVAAMLQVAMAGRVPVTQLRDMMFAHPTLAESLNNLFATI